jgi:ParB family chromosome partitioning protein
MGQGVDADGFGWQLSASSTSGTVITSGGQPIGADLSDEEDGAQKPLPERLVMELAAHRSLALREAIGRSPEVALALLLLKLVMDNRPHLLCLGRLSRNSVRHVYISAQAHDLKDSVVARLID